MAGDGAAAGVEFYDMLGVATDSADAVVVVGVGGPSSTDMVMLKYDADGAALWGKYLIEGGTVDVAYDVETDSVDNIVVVGTSNYGDASDIWVAKLAP